MAKGSNSAVPETPVKSGGTDNYYTEMLVETPGTDEYTGRSVSFEEDAHESGEAMEEDYDLEEKEDIPEDAILAAGRSSGARPLASWRNSTKSSDPNQHLEMTTTKKETMMTMTRNRL
ncbi:hypothetical protein PHMEG_00034152 [Phytophthora megakarya]|uniref:Eukaryotic/viral aspartic protease n=1 Tax=Phytophthora megakarya TaxID=4795 RepID=A0A225URN4_9STRA|nr:hypothetical protein PHMEG_00034152 [Phytophthora megakarya]